MSQVAQKALNSYSKANVDAGVAGASPHRLIVMLFDGALAAITKAKAHMSSREVNDIAEKGRCISKAVAIIEDGLMASLNMEVGGDLAQNLRSLYEYFVYRLVNANLENNIDALNEVSERLMELRDAWVSITPAQSTQHGRDNSTFGAGSYGHV
jgi:flagellar protein FliS